MDALTEHEMEVIVQRLETLVTDLEHNGSTPTFYAFVLLAQEFAGTKKAPFTLTHIRRCLVLAHRVRAIRDRLVSAGGRWTPPCMTWARCSTPRPPGSAASMVWPARPVARHAARCSRRFASP